MKYKTFIIWIILSVISLFVAACGSSAGRAGIPTAYLSTDAGGNEGQDIFTIDDIPVLQLEFDESAVNKQLTLSISNDNKEVADGNYIIKDTEPLRINLLRPGSRFPTGKYSVTLELDDAPISDLDLSFEVLPSNVPTPTIPPTVTPRPIPTATPTRESSQPSQLGVPDQEKFEGKPIAPALQLQDTGTYASGAFTLRVPEGWERQATTEANELLVSYVDTAANQETLLGAAFLNVETEAENEDKLIELLRRYATQIADQYVDDYAEKEFNDETSDIYYLQYTYNDGQGDMHFYFERVDDILYVIYLITPDYPQFHNTWVDVVNSYEFDPTVAAELATTLDIVGAWPPPIPTPTPQCVRAPLTGRCIEPRPGQGIFLVINRSDLDLTVGGDGALGNSFQVPPNSDEFISLPPGRYQYYINAVDGSRGDKGQIDLVAGEIVPRTIGYDPNE